MTDAGGAQPLVSKFVNPSKPESNKSLPYIREVGVMPEGFPGVYIGEMDSDKGNCHPQQGIAQGDAGMGKGGRVDQIKSCCPMAA